ncbi:MAG: MCE family protein [Nocardioides sp.]|uniref:MCE family protein n=1 Tax=Nocardioides sp. TaxID=35761 RepID=UPI0039E22F26
MRLAGIGLILSIAAAVCLTAAFYTHAFSSDATVSVETSRSGLIMAAGNKVKMRGVEIGRVDSVERDGDHVRLQLAIRRDQLSQIPANVLADIRATTVFGAKYVALSSPAQPDTARLAPGAVIDARSVTTEVQTVFGSLYKLLTAVDVTNLNQTLTVLARSLEGRGDEIADAARKADDYLTRLEPELPELRRSLVEFARTSGLLEQVSPDLLAILKNATVTATTVVTKKQAIARVLTDLALFGDSGTALIKDDGSALTTFITSLRLPAGTLRAYSSELPCFIQGAEQVHQTMTKTFGEVDSGLRAELSVRGGLQPYTYPKDLPGVGADGSAGCHGLPSVPLSQIPITDVAGNQE